MSRSRRSLLVLAACAASAAFAAPASATVVQIGATAPAVPAEGTVTASTTALQVSTDPGSPSYVVPPGNWTVTCWSIQGQSFPGEARLRVYRPEPNNDPTPGFPQGYTLIGESANERFPATDGAAWAFATSIPVQGGDQLAMRSGEPGLGASSLYDTPFAQDRATLIRSSGEGQVIVEDAGANLRVNVAAVLQTADEPPPIPCGDLRAPVIRFRGSEVRRITKSRLTVRFGADEQATFICSLDGKRARPCTSPLKLRRIDLGRHVLRVEATDGFGNETGKPAKLVIRRLED